MLLLMLVQVATLGEVLAAVNTAVRSQALMHPHMIEDIPGLSELFPTAAILASVQIFGFI